MIENTDLIPGSDDAFLEHCAPKNYKADLKLYKILKKSIDARKKGRVVIKYRAVFIVDDKDYNRLIKAGCAPYHEKPMTEQNFTRTH